MDTKKYFEFTGWTLSSNKVALGFRLNSDVKVIYLSYMEFLDMAESLDRLANYVCAELNPEPQEVSGRWESEYPSSVQISKGGVDSPDARDMV